ncbi:MAG: DUF433 domain-containing protein [Acidobacteria bacterium]|nr:DUF433 domain-containing protein [Acidobacteriota bacterium]
MLDTVDIASTSSLSRSQHTVGIVYAGNGKHTPETDAAVTVRADISGDSIRLYVTARNRKGRNANFNERQAKEAFRTLAERLREKHQGIGVNERVLGGEPHIKGTRVSVAHVLAHLYHSGSVDAIVNEFKQRISKEQVKQALAYAHDFMEMACDPSQDDD